MDSEKNEMLRLETAMLPMNKKGNLESVEMYKFWENIQR
jgi:hypothetical protein